MLSVVTETQLSFCQNLLIGDGCVRKRVESEKMSMKTDENAKYVAKIAENKLNCPNLNFVELRGTSKSIKISSKNTWFILFFWS